MRSAVVVLVLALAMVGCGGGGPRTTTRPSTSAGKPPAPYSSLSFSRDASRTAVGVDGDQSVCGLLSAAEVGEAIGRGVRLRAAANDSYQLSICRYAGSGAVVRAVLDGAADATRRYFNMAAEADQIPKLQHGASDFRLVWDVGDDDTYGGAGAFWQPSVHRLVAIRFDHIVRVTVSAPGATDHRRRVLASRLARRVLVRANR